MVNYRSHTSHRTKERIYLHQSDPESPSYCTRTHFPPRIVHAPFLARVRMHDWLYECDESASRHLFVYGNIAIDTPAECDYQRTYGSFIRPAFVMLLIPRRHSETIRRAAAVDARARGQPHGVPVRRSQGSARANGRLAAERSAGEKRLGGHDCPQQQFDHWPLRTAGQYYV